MNPDEVLAFIVNFSRNCDGGESFWIDPDGHKHSADMGYAIEFLEDLEKYVKAVGGFEKFAKKANSLMD